MPVEITKLPNGLVVVTDSMPDLATAAVGVWVNVGTRDEAENANGVAHLVEHMLFKGTPTRNAFQITAEIEDVGGHLNAYTTREQTAYYARVLADDVPRAVAVLADFLQNSTLPEDELVRERDVIIQEINQTEDQPDEWLYDLVTAANYPQSRLGRPVLGTVDVIKKLPRAALVDYIGGFYGAPHMVLASAGKVDHKAMCDLASTCFGGVGAAKVPPRAPASFRPAQVRSVKDLEQVHALITCPGVSYTDSLYYAMHVLSQALGGGMSSRLFQEVREKRGLVYSVYSTVAPYTDGGWFGVYASATPKNFAEALPIMVEQTRSVAETLTDEELARAKAQLRSSLLMGLESPSGRAESAAQHYFLYGRAITVEEMNEKLAAVDKKAVQAASSVLHAQPYSLGVIGPKDGLKVADKIAA